VELDECRAHELAEAIEDHAEPTGALLIEGAGDAQLIGVPAGDQVEAERDVERAGREQLGSGCEKRG